MDISQLSIEPPEEAGYPFTIPTDPPIQIRLRSPQSPEVVRAVKAADFIAATNARDSGATVEEWIGDAGLTKDVYVSSAAVIDFGGMTCNGEPVNDERTARKFFSETNGGRNVAIMIARELDRIQMDFRKASKASSDGRDTLDTSTAPQTTAKKAG